MSIRYDSYATKSEYYTRKSNKRNLWSRNRPVIYRRTRTGNEINDTTVGLYGCRVNRTKNDNKKITIINSLTELAGGNERAKKERKTATAPYVEKRTRLGIDASSPRNNPTNASASTQQTHLSISPGVSTLVDRPQNNSTDTSPFYLTLYAAQKCDFKSTPVNRSSFEVDQ